MTLVNPGWPQNYSAELNAELPPAGGAVPFRWSDSASRSSVLVKVKRGNDSWVGAFEAGDGTVTGLYAAPSPDHLLVVAKGQAYWVPTTDPKKYELVAAYPVRSVMQVAAARVVVIADDTDIVAYGVAGKLWTTRRLSSDGIKIDGANSEGIWGRAWNAAEEQPVEFSVDLKTGEAKGGLPT